MGRSSGRVTGTRTSPRHAINLKRRLLLQYFSLLCFACGLVAEVDVTFTSFLLIV